MRTLKLKISEIAESDVRLIRELRKQHSGAFRMIYKHAELLADKEFEREIRSRFCIDSWIYQCLRVEVEMKKSQVKTIDDNKKSQLSELQNEHEKISQEAVDADFKKGRKWRRRKFQVERAIRKLEASIGRDITFGGRELLQRITRLHNALGLVRKQKELIKIELEINELTEQYHEKRLLGLTIIGEAPQKSNRKFDFDFLNKKVVFKPSMGVKIPIAFHASKKQQRTLEKLQSMVCEIALSVRLSEDYICISWDDERVSRYGFNQREYEREKKMIQRGSDKQEFKNLKQKWHKEQEARMLVGKVLGRTLAVDLNPENIGVCVIDKSNNFEILHKEVIVLDALNTALGVASSHRKQKHQRNKRDHEIKEVWKDITNIALHNRCESITVEDFDFKDKAVNDFAKSANKKIKNLWHRELTLQLIDKYCKQYGMKKIAVNACYSTFIGNIKHKYYDPLNAALELGRRGLVQFEKGNFYPKIEGSDVDTMSRNFGLDVQDKTISNWVDAFNLFKTAGLRYRRGLEQCSEFAEKNLSSHKSGVKRLHFYT